MSKNFTSSWTKQNKPSISRRISDTMHEVPLKDKVSKTVYRLNMVRRKLEDSRNRMDQKHRTLFNKCVRAQETKDTRTAVMYANECAQVKKMAQTVVSSQLALEQVVLRLETVEDFGDIAAEIMPAAGVIRAVKGRLSGVIPEVSMQLNTIGTTLDTLVLEVGQATGQSWNNIASGEDSERILAEAAAIAEQKVREGFPELPSVSTERRISPL